MLTDVPDPGSTPRPEADPPEVPDIFAPTTPAVPEVSVLPFSDPFPFAAPDPLAEAALPPVTEPTATPTPAPDFGPPADPFDRLPSLMSSLAASPTTAPLPPRTPYLPVDAIAPPVTAPVPGHSDLAEPAEIDTADSIPHTRPIDPALVYIILLVVMVLGLGGLAPELRYTALWTTLIVVAVLAMLFDNLEVEIPTAPDMAWGIGYGLILGLPLLVIALPQLRHTSLLLFEQGADTLAFQSLVMVMPTAEALFFRGAVQPTRGLLFTALAGSAWSMLLFFPQLHVVEAPLVALVIGFAFIVLNFLYSYIKRRFGLFASWTCQITVNLLLLFICRFL